MTITRSQLIVTLKSRGIKGKLSKMTKGDLMDLVRKSAPPSGGRGADAGISLEPDHQQDGGHYFDRKGNTRSDGKHTHVKDPWPADSAPARAKKKKKKKDPLVDPDAKLTAALVNKRINADLHPGTGRKLRGQESGERFRWLLRRKFGDAAVTAKDLEERLFNVDEEYRKEYPGDSKKDGGAVDRANITADPRSRREPDRLPQPATFDVERRGEAEQGGEGLSYHAYMRANLKQHGGNMQAAAAAYRGQAGGHFVDSKSGKPSAGETMKYKHSHPGLNPAPRGSSGGDSYKSSNKSKSKLPEAEPSDDDEDLELTDDEDAAAAPRLTRQTSPRSRRRIGRTAPMPAQAYVASLPRGEQRRAAQAIRVAMEGPAQLSAPEAVRLFKARRIRDAQAGSQPDEFVDDGEEDQPLGEQGGGGFESWMAKHPFIQSMADDALGGIAVVGLGLVTGGLSEAFAPAEDLAVTSALKGAVSDTVSTATAGARAAAEDAVQGASRAVTTATTGARAAAADAVQGASSAVTTTADDAVASATDAMQATRDRVSAAVTDAATSATASVKKRVGEEVDRVTADATQAFRGKAKAAAKAVGLGVAGERGELLGKTAEEEFEADKEDNPAPAPPPTGLLQTDADIRQLRGLFAQRHSAMDDGPRPFGNPWYS